MVSNTGEASERQMNERYLVVDWSRGWLTGHHKFIIVSFNTSFDDAHLLELMIMVLHLVSMGSP